MKETNILRQSLSEPQSKFQHSFRRMELDLMCNWSRGLEFDTDSSMNELFLRECIDRIPVTCSDSACCLDTSTQTRTSTDR